MAQSTIKALERRIRELEASLSELRRADEERNASLRFLDAVIDASPTPMWVAEDSGTVIRTNQALRDTIRLTDDRIIGQYNVLSDQNIENAGLMPIVRGVFQQHAPAQFSMRWKAALADGVDFTGARDMHIDVSMIPILDGRGKLRNVVCQWVDVTALKEAESTVKEALLKQRQAIRAGRVGLWDWDLKTDRVHFSREWKQQIGYADHEIGDDFEEWRKRVHPEDLKPALEKVNRSIAAASDDHEAEFRFRHRDGTYRWILTHASIIKDDAGRPVRMVGSHVDITERKRTEDELRKNESLLQRVFDILPIGLWFADNQGKLLRGNPAGIEIWGTEPHVGPEEYGVFTARRLPAMEEIAPDDWALAHTIREGVTVTDELLEIDAFDGRKKTILNYTAPVLDAEGHVEAAVIVNLDVSERIRAEREALRSEVRLRTLIDTIPDLIWLKDEAGVYLSCNPTFERFFGAAESEIVGKTDYDFVDRKLADFFRDHDRRALAAGGPSMNEERLTFKADGYTGLFETIKTPMRNSDGSIVGVLGIARDISKRKEAEVALRENERRYKSAQRMGRVGNWEYDIATERFWGSEQAKRIYGFDPESRNFTTDQVEQCIIDRERVHQALVDLIEKNKPYNLEFAIRPVSGPSERIIRSIAELTTDEDGTPRKVMGVIQDITEQKAAEREKIQLERRLKQSQKMESIGNLAGGIAHDFNNILSAIIGFTEIALEEAPKGSILDDSLQEIYSAGERARDLVKQILTFARQSDEKQSTIKPSAIAKEVLQFIRSTIPANIEIRQRIESDAIIMGNAIQIHQVLMNLCTNAAHAMADSGGVLDVALSDLTIDEQQSSMGFDPGDYIEIAVSDTGSGIAPGTIGSIFDPYFTTKGLGEGTGMGLAMTHGIVESYGGKISVDSEPGKGTTFRILLPATRKPSAQNADVPEEVPLGTERILFVDDEHAIAKTCGLILSRLGYSVTTRTSSIEALALFKARPKDYDLVLTDMTMPGMTGDELAIELMKIRPDIPVILCTGYSKKISDEAAFHIGIRAVAHKPMAKANLAETIRMVLDGAKGITRA